MNLNHVDSTINSGLIHLKRIDEHRGKTPNYRDDPDEGIQGIFQGSQSILKISEKGTDYHEVPFTVMREFVRSESSFYVCSFTDVTKIPVKGEYCLSPLLRKFGNCVVIILKPNEFLQRIKEVMDAKNYKYKLDYVKYTDLRTQHREIKKEDFAFVKDLSYSWQSEFRIVVETENETEEEINFNIGDIRDISLLADFDNVVIKTTVKTLS